MVDTINKADEDKGRYWQPPEKRNQLSEEAKKWLEENAEAAKEWAKWADEHELPLDKYRMF
ncbi:MAG: type II toxin-antitoxin system CcdA family antitoxin [Devosia sp.]